MIRGEVVYLHAFDVANEIIHARVKDIMTGTKVPFEIRTDHTLPKDIPLYKPLAVESTPYAAAIPQLQIRPTIHIYEVGVLSVVMRVTFAVEGLPALLPFHRLRLENGQTLGQAARALCMETCKSLKDAMVQCAPLPEPEAYTAFCLTEIDTSQPLGEWMNARRNEIAELLSENAPGQLSEMQVNEIMRVCRSYSPRDLTILDWDAALLVDLTGYVEDELYVLELANLQLEEYRVMDQRLDRYLNRAYEDIRQQRSGLFGTYTATLRNLRTLRVDVTRLNDEVTNITKFFGDWYLARVYLDARERFHVNQWKSSVEERLRQIDALYTVAHTELTNRRMLWLEAIIVIFFAIDLLGIFVLGK